MDLIVSVLLFIVASRYSFENAMVAYWGVGNENGDAITVTKFPKKK